MPHPYWLTDQSQRHVNPNRPIGEVEVLELTEGSVLDYGCGVGRLARFFSPQSYTGVDVNANRINRCHTTYPDHLFMVIKDHNDIVGLERDTIIADNVLLHVSDEELPEVIGAFSKVATRVVIAEHLGRHWRPEVLHQCPCYNRDLRDYEKLFANVGMGLSDHRLVMNPKYKAEMSVALWRK